MSDTFGDITGLVSLTDHDVGKCRVDFIDYTASPTYDDTTKMGTLEGTPNTTIGRDVAEIIAGAPEGILAVYGVKDKGGFKVTLQEFQIGNLGKQLGLEDTRYTNTPTPMSKIWDFGGDQTIRYFSARISKRRPDGNYLVITFHKGYFKPEISLNHAAGPNFRDLEFVAMVDSTKDVGENVGNIEVTATSPW